MKLVSTEVKKAPKSENIYCVGLAIDSGIYYAALVDIKTQKNYVEEVSLSPTKQKFTGVFKKIVNEELWRKLCAFFNAAGVFEQFWKGKNWRWHKENGKESIPNWFDRKYINK